MAEGKDKICCIFQQKDAELAVNNRKLETIEVLRDSPRRKQVVCRCRLCGGTVLYDYEEVANLYGGWDNADIFEHWYPVEVQESEPSKNLNEQKWQLVEGAQSIYGHNLEGNEVFQYSYQDC